MKRARRFNKRIEILQSSSVPDGFGGNVVTLAKVGTSWCNIKTLSIQRVTDLGLNDNNTVIEVNLRYRDDLDYNVKDTALRYKGVDYNILRVDPVDLEGVNIKITAATNG